MRADAIVIGAGVSGLACASRLRTAGLAVTVLEARERVGGRVLTHRDPDGGPPEELGAQVVHGRANPLLPVLGQVSEGSLNGTARAVTGGTAHPMGRLAASGNPPWAVEERLIRAEDCADVSVAGWLRDQDLSEPERAVAAEWFRQNWAAEPDQLGAQGVRVAHRRNRAGTGEFTVPGGFDQVTSWLLDGTAVRLGVAVREVSWTPGRVTVRADGMALEATAVVVTVPPPLVAGGRLAISGLPVGKQAAAAALPLGDGWCAVLTVDRPAPESAVVFDADGLGGFLRSIEGRPKVRIVAKAGAAARMRATAQSDLVGVVRRALPWVRDVVRVDVADWGADEWSQGAFTYPRPRLGWAARSWAEPLAGTVFFAGEATQGGDGPPSVHGAVATGQRAAEQVMEAMAK